MGGCCSSSKHELSRTSIYTCCPDASERRPLPTDRGSVSVLPTGLLVIQNVDTAIPDSFRPPPLPLPFSMGLNNSDTLSRGYETSSDKADPALSTERESDYEGFDDLKLAGSLTMTGYSKAAEDKSSMLNIYNASSMEEEEEEDVCPTCFEEYDVENPRIITKCQHHFHLSCIYEWMERSDTCPICDQLMLIDHAYHE